MVAADLGRLAPTLICVGVVSSLVSSQRGKGDDHQTQGRCTPARTAVYKKGTFTGSTLVRDLLQAGPSLPDRQRAFDKYSAEVVSDEFFKIRLLAVTDVKSAARELLMKIMGVTGP